MKLILGAQKFSKLRRLDFVYIKFKVTKVDKTKYFKVLKFDSWPTFDAWVREQLTRDKTLLDIVSIGIIKGGK
jgi:hypothetical protein